MTQFTVHNSQFILRSQFTVYIAASTNGKLKTVISWKTENGKLITEARGVL